MHTHRMQSAAHSAKECQGVILAEEACKAVKNRCIVGFREGFGVCRWHSAQQVVAPRGRAHEQQQPHPIRCRFSSLDRQTFQRFSRHHCDEVPGANGCLARRGCQRSCETTTTPCFAAGSVQSPVQQGLPSSAVAARPWGEEFVQQRSAPFGGQGPWPRTASGRRTALLTARNA